MLSVWVGFNPGNTKDCRGAKKAGGKKGFRETGKGTGAGEWI